MTLEELRKKGFDVDSAMVFCINSEEIYRDVLDTALEEGLEKIPVIGDCVEREDYKRYCIEVHGLKNAARQIGANTLSDMAFEHEKAAKEDNISFIRENVTALLEKYKEDLDIIKEFLEK